MVINLKWIFSNKNRAFAFGLGSGLLLAPGTSATIFAWLIWQLLFFNSIEPIIMGSIIIITFFYGCYICNIVSQELKVTDHPSIVIDEIVSFWLILFFIKDVFYIRLISFLLFRILDIFKPFPINIIDQSIKNGFGIMLDDLLAAIFTICIVNYFF